jgi:hypothetical protein
MSPVEAVSQSINRIRFLVAPTLRGTINFSLLYNGFQVPVSQTERTFPLLAYASPIIDSVDTNSLIMNSFRVVKLYTAIELDPILYTAEVSCELNLKMLTANIT